jgi:hypothetical protein
MRTTARLLLAGAIAAASFGLTTPASACDYKPGGGCGGCKLTPHAYLDGGRLVDCPS